MSYDKELDDILAVPILRTSQRAGAKAKLSSLLQRVERNKLEQIWNKLPQAIMQPPNVYYNAYEIDGLIQDEIKALNEPKEGDK